MFSEVGRERVESYAIDLSFSMRDKLFFFDKVDTKTFVDYGCADGEMGRALRRLDGSIRYFGYDMSPAMIARGRGIDPGIELYDRWDELTSSLDDEPATLILSSIIHEVYSYGNLASISTFLRRTLRNARWRRIVIRDMIPDAGVYRRSDLRDVEKIRAVAGSRLAEYEVRRGSIEMQANLLGFLLRYRYESDWARELDEDYMPLTERQLMMLIPEDLTVTYVSRRTPSFIKKRARLDFGIKNFDDVHLSVVLSRS